MAYISLYLDSLLFLEYFIHLSYFLLSMYFKGVNDPLLLNYFIQKFCPEKKVCKAESPVQFRTRMHIGFLEQNITLEDRNHMVRLLTLFMDGLGTTTRFTAS